MHGGSEKFNSLGTKPMYYTSLVVCARSSVVALAIRRQSTLSIIRAALGRNDLKSVRMDGTRVELTFGRDHNDEDCPSDIGESTARMIPPWEG